MAFGREKIMFWYKEDEKRWAVLYFDPVTHKRRRLNDYDPPRVNPPEVYAADDDFDDDVVVVAVENDRETKRMKDLRVACEKSYEFKRVHARIKRGVVLRDGPSPWLLRPDDQMPAGYSFVSDNSRVFLQLAGASIAPCPPVITTPVSGSSEWCRTGPISSMSSL